MKHIFIDANIFVQFFEMSKESISELEMLVTLIKSDEATLWMPKQAQREFWKNREKNIHKYLRDFDKHKALGAAPLLLREHERFKELDDLAKKTDALKAELTQSLKGQLSDESTAADHIIRELFEAATSIDTDDEALFRTAFRRAQCHIPPGKKDDLGDRLNWVALLEKLPFSADLHIIADDVDYKSDASSDIHPYLKKEWATKNKGDVILWGRISKFIAQTFPDADNAKDFERKFQIQRLAESGSFSTTHLVIAELSKLSNFTDQQVQSVAKAITENQQVWNIIEDKDVKAFTVQFLAEYKSKMPAHIAELLAQYTS
jgi:hypothetical protein